MKFKKISDNLKQKVEKEVKMMLHASRDCLRNQGEDTTKITFSCKDGYYGEAFGVMRGLKILGYGDFGSNNMNGLSDMFISRRGATQKEHNLKWWFDQIDLAVLIEEGYYSDMNYGKSGNNYQCNYCFERWGKDSVRRK